MGTNRHRVGLAFAIGVAVFANADPGGAHWLIDGSGNVTLDINFRYPPAAGDIARLEAELNRARLALCDATDGQVKLSTVNFTSGEGSQETADIWLLDHQGRSSATGVITLFVDGQRGDVITHELGHHLFQIGDEYPENRRDGGCGIGPSFDEDVQLDEVWHSIMQNSGWQVCRDPNTGLSLREINPADFWDWPCTTDADCGELCTAPGCPADPTTSSGFVSLVCPNPPLLASELSVALNHDQRKGTGEACPAPRAGSIFTLGAQLHPDEWASTPTPGAGDRSRNCGNGVIDPGESCDGTNLNGETCTSLGYAAGLLGCHANCGFSTSLCGAPTTSCGDSILQAGEDCDGTSPWPSGLSCADFGFTGVSASVPYANLSCNANCTANVSQCPGTATPFDPSSFETAQQTSVSWTQVEVIDSLGRVEGPGALFGGQSSHQLWVFFEHVSGDAWTLWFYGRGEEYQGGVAGTPYLIDSLALVFSGPDLLTINGNPAANPVGITLGGTTTGPFTPGADSSVAPEVQLELRLGNFKRETWTTFWNATGWSRVTQALVTAGEPGTPGELQLGICASDVYCKGWNSATGRFESTAATIYEADPSNPRSDWQVMFETFRKVPDHNPAGFTIAPIPLDQVPLDATPTDAQCGGPISINDLTTSPDQVLMVLDRSGSMSETTKIPDFNQDGKTRLEYVQAAARAYVTLVHGQPVDLGLISFSGTQSAGGLSTPIITVDQNLVRVDDTLPAMPPSISQESFHAIIDGLVADGRTPIGTALKQARDLFATTAGAQKAVFLLSDGENNAGEEDPLEEVRLLRAAGVTVYSVALGDAADEFLSREMAFLGGGAMLDAPNGDEVPMTFLDLFARNRSESLALARTESVVAGADTCNSGEFPCNVGLVPVTTPYGCLCLEPDETEPEIPPKQSFPITVEAGADRLNVMLSSRNPNSSAWVPEFRLKDPSGTVVMDQASPQVVSDPLFRLLRVANPSAGSWALEVSAPDEEIQYSYLAAHVENAAPDCFLSFDQPVVPDGSPAVVTARAYFDSVELYDGVTFTGRVLRPDGAAYTLSFTRSSDPAGGYTATMPDAVINGRGAYTAVVRCEVAANARFVPGETTFAETRTATAPQQAPIVPPSQPAIDVVPFIREANASFFADSVTAPPLPPGDDCDGDGIADSAEVSGDLDADGLPNVCDDDADNDDVPDSVDPDPLDPNVPTPQDCELEPLAIACCEALAECTGTESVALYAQSELRINDRATVLSDGTPGAVINAGLQQTHLGVDSDVGNVWSEANVFGAERALIAGDLTTAGSLTQQNNVTITGELLQHAALDFPNLAAFSVTFPETDLGNRELQPGQVLSVPPGVYRSIAIKSGATLRLSTGSYFLTGSFSLEPQGKVEFDTSRGPVFLYVNQGFLYKGAFVDSRGEHDNVFVGYFGTQDAFAETAFSGTLVVPNAKLWLKTTTTPHRGSFFAKRVDLAAQAVVEHYPFPLAWTYGNRLVLGAQLSTATAEQAQAASGCGCSVPAGGRHAGWVSLLLGLGLACSRRRRR